MTPSPLALRLGGQDHALEPGRDYVLGTDPACDLPLPAGAAARHAALHVGADGVEVEDLGGGVAVGGTAVGRARLAAGDVVAFARCEARIVPDTGAALLVPLPALRTAAASRRQAAVRTAANALLRRREAETFEDLMAHELQRAPWLGASLLLHVLALLLLWLLLPASEGGTDAEVTVQVDLRDPRPPGGAPPAAPDVVVEPPPIDLAVMLPDPPADASEASEPTAAPVPDAPGGQLRANARLVPRPTRAASGGDEGLTAEVAGVGSAGFRRTVAELQSGLEIVFVFDSTGSMSRTIQDTKQTIAQMLTVLRALVPGARFGIVTFRDRGKREVYCVRELPLGDDFWRAGNFVQGVTAEGGGDEPEDVRAGLKAAFAQRWQTNARRVVVLAGDAPPHSRDESRLLGEVKAFARDRRSFVHTLITSPQRASRAARDAFAAIAEAGGGECLDLDDHDRVLQRVLALAFGSEYDRDVAAATAAIAAAAERVDVAALDLAHRGGPDLAAALRERPVPAMLLHALVRRPRQGVALELVDLLGERRTPEHTRHAIAWVLQRTLDLRAPPVDPESGDRPDAERLDRLRAACQALDD